MSTCDTTPYLTADGIAFTVIVDYQQRACMISRDVLTKLSQSTNKNLDLLATFYAYQANISGVARRLAAAGVQGTPLSLSIRNFT